VTVDAQSIETDRAPGGGTLRIEFQLGVVAIDPALAYYSVSDWQVPYATCAQLLNYPDRSRVPGSQLTAEAATGLPTRSPDGKSYTFTIRRGVRFSPPSNEPVTAQTFKHTIERALNPAMKAPLAYEFADIAGAAEYIAGKKAAHRGRRRGRGQAHGPPPGAGPGDPRANGAADLLRGPPLTRRTIPRASALSPRPGPTTSPPTRPARASSSCATPTTPVAVHTASIGSNWTWNPIPAGCRGRGIRECRLHHARRTRLTRPAWSRLPARCPLRTRQPRGESRQAAVLLILNTHRPLFSDGAGATYRLAALTAHLELRHRSEPR
jgi:Bacterial extracellular solute-binding proteins, family 5 Middle